MGYRCEKQKGPEAPSLIISNHNTDLDPALVGLAFSRQMYYLASEHAFRNGFASKMLKFLFDPIPFNKTRADVYAIKEMIRRLKAGANVCLFAEGDRSFTGITAPVPASTAKLVKLSGVEMVTFRLEGGYFTTPRWSKKKRKGKMTGAMVNRYTVEELKGMTEEQIISAIDRDIYEDACERQKVRQDRFCGENLAESIETALFLCPGCNKIGAIRSEGDRFFCGCGLSGVYTETGMLEGAELRFSTTSEWGKWQDEQLETIVGEAGGGVICSDEGQTLYKVRPAIDKTLIGEGQMSIDREVFRCAGHDFPVGQITKFAIVGQMTLLFSTIGGESYEVRSNAPRSALKYREIFRVLTESD